MDMQKFMCWSFIFLLCSGFERAKTVINPRLSSSRQEFLTQKIEFLGGQIRNFENSYTQLGDRNVFKKTSDYSYSFQTDWLHNLYDVDNTTSEPSDATHQYKVNKFMHAENCFIAAAIEVYDEDKHIVKIEEGPVNLRKVSRVRTVPYVPHKSLGWQLTFDSEKTNFPELYFESDEVRAKAKIFIDKLISLCQERYQSHLELYLEEKTQSELRVPSSDEFGAREIRYHEEDQSMRAALLTNGTKALAARLKISEEATKPGDSILIQYLIFMADEAGMRLSQELIKKAQDGVRVEVIIDALSPFLDIRDLTIRSNTKKMYNNLMAAGIPVHGYRCAPHLRIMDEMRLGHKLDSDTLNQRPHEKFWIVNKSKAIVGGMNIGNDYFRINKHGFGYWRDQDVLIEGREIIQDMINIVEGNILSNNHNFLNPREDSCFNSFDPVKETQSYQKFMTENTKAYKMIRVRESKKDHQAYALAEIKKIERALRDQGEEVRFDFEDLKAARIIQNRPKLKELHIEDAYLELIQNAKKEILISNAYFIPSDDIKKALRRAAKRGVKVVILTNSYQSNDVPPVAVLSRYGYKELVDYNYSRTGQSGQTREIEIYEWTGEEDASGHMQQGTNHAKYMVVDRKILFIGSYNLDPRSRNINSEVNLAFEGQSGKLAQDLAKEFYEIDLNFAHRVTYREMLSHRKPLKFMNSLILLIKGYEMDKDLFQVGKESFFRKIAEYNENTW